MSKLNLSPEQEQIINFGEGAFVVKASAGSGKTRVLTERIKRLANQGVNKILAITFTNKAGEEIKDRLGDSENIRNSVFVGTFHSFCQYVLETRFKLLGFTEIPHIFEEDSDRLELIEEAIFSIPYFQEIYEDLENKDKYTYKYKVLNFISEVKRELISPEELVAESENEELLLLYETYQDILASNNAIDFDDLILLIYKLFINNEAVTNLYRRSYKYICIDEAQDLNKAQYFLLKALAGETIKNIMLVGDPNQSIYAFNGSSSNYMDKLFIEDFNAQIFELQENYRCSKRVIIASNKLMNLEVKAINYVIDGIFEINEFNNEDAEAEYIVKKILELVALKEHSDIEGQIDYSKISILARNKFVFENIDKLLRLKNIPFFYKTGNAGLKFRSRILKIFDCYFRIKINSNDKLHLKRLEDILLVDDVYNPELLKMSKHPESEYILELVRDITIENIAQRLIGFRKLFEENVRFQLDDEERKNIIEEINDLLQHWIIYNKQNLKPTLTGFKNSISLGVTNKTKIHNGIVLSTVHTMKGQESDIVFVMGMDDGTFPDYRAINKKGVELQQELNNAYVAFTRSKRFLYITYPKTRRMPWGDIKSRTVSRFLKDFM